MMNRRQMLQSLSCGFGYLALGGIASAQQKGAAASANPLAPKVPMFPAKAKRVIFMYMQGAPSQYETFDYCPDLGAGSEKSRTLMAPAFNFTKSGQSGLPISDLFPHLQKCADDLCIMNGMTTDSPAHPTATIELHTGSATFVRPSMGSWVVYGLGTENQNLPGFITINPAGQGGAQNFGSAFLPASYEGTPYLTRAGRLPNIANPEMKSPAQRKQVDFIQSMNQEYLEKANADSELEGVIESYEMAFRMQTAAPGILDVQGESEATLAAYGINDAATREFGTQCLLARRLAQSGVRFIEISNNGWDTHNNLRQRMQQNARQVDQPIAALINDLKQRGLLKDTLLLWGGEFGRTTNGQGNDGRNHNSRGYTMWMAGGGVKGGLRYGSTDPVTGVAVDGKMHLHDLHATMLNLLGLDHTRLTYPYGGRNFRLTEVYGNVVKSVMA
jgi:hypothetical protein